MSRHRSNILLLLGILAAGEFVRNASAQDTSPAQQPSADQSKPSAPDANAKKPSDKQEPVPPTGGETTGKSKLEKETGTVNDRIFEVMPNYGTVENAGKLPPLSTGQKYRLATASVTDYFTIPFNMALAGLDQAHNSPESWGQGWGAYGKRFGASFADNSIGTYMTVAVFPSMLHEDPRYYQMGKGSFKKRAWHGIERLFVTYTDSGSTRFNISEVVGNAAAAGISNIYHAPEDRTVGRNIGTLGMLIMWDGASNELKEFWPDIRRKVFHKQNP